MFFVFHTQPKRRQGRFRVDVGQQFGAEGFVLAAKRPGPDAETSGVRHLRDVGFGNLRLHPQKPQIGDTKEGFARTKGASFHDVLDEKVSASRRVDRCVRVGLSAFLACNDFASLHAQKQQFFPGTSLHPSIAPFSGVVQGVEVLLFGFEDVGRIDPRQGLAFFDFHEASVGVEFDDVARKAGHHLFQCRFVGLEKPVIGAGEGHLLFDHLDGLDVEKLFHTRFSAKEQPGKRQEDRESFHGFAPISASMRARVL